MPIDTLNTATESGNLLPRGAVFCFTDTHVASWNTGGVETIGSGTLESKVHIDQHDQEKLTSGAGFVYSFQYGDIINGPLRVSLALFTTGPKLQCPGHLLLL